MNARYCKKKLLEVFAAERQQKQEAAAQRRSQRAEHLARCEQLARDLDELEHGRVVYYRQNAAGEREYIDDAARARRADESRSLYQKNCG